MKDVPFSAYDFFGYLAAGFVLLAGLDHAGGTHVLVSNVSVLAGFLLLILAYTVGHVIAQLSSALLERLLARRVLGPTTALLFATRRLRPWHRLFPGYTTTLPPETQRRVLERAKAKGLTSPGEGLFFHCLAIVRRDTAALGRLNTFLALYGFARNLSVTLFLCALLVYVGPRVTPTLSSGSAAAVVLLLAVTLVYRYLKFYRLYAVEVYTNYAEPDTSSRDMST